MIMDSIPLASSVLTATPKWEISKPSPMKVSCVMDRHANSFIDIIKKVYDDYETMEKDNCMDNENAPHADILSLAVPPILAIHSLIERKWTPPPGSIGPDVVRTLTWILRSLCDEVSVSEEEKERIITAVTCILRLCSYSSSDLAEHVFSNA